ncbi:MAG TPA: YihY/virulence factor BrkB family protein [Solirubrobacteraceae bacterium]|nr:YihY/virulence factor BrkB family protein [Solirubrobacteraceae bacterium]
MKQTARRLVAVLGAAGSRYLSSGASDAAAGIAYRVLFSLAPLTVALASVFGLLLQNEQLKNDVINKIVAVLPVKSGDVSQAIQNIATPASAAGLVSLIVLVWAASGMMRAMRSSLERTMDVQDDRGLVRGKVIDIALVAATAVLVLASVGIGLVTQLVDGVIAGLASAAGVQGSVVKSVVSRLLPLLLWTATLLLLYRVVPAKRPRLGDALAGAVVTAVLLLAISLAAGFIYAHATKWSFIYGSLTSVFVFLYSVYLFASAMLFGAACAAEWSRPHPADPEPVSAKLRRRIRGLLHPTEKSR